MTDAKQSKIESLAVSQPACRRSMRGRVFLAGIVVLILGAMAVGLGAAGNHTQPAPPLAENTMPVRTTVIEKVKSFQLRRSHAGTIKAHRTSRLGFERMGKLIEIAVCEGQRVKAGQVLARLDTRQLETKKRELQTQRNQAASALDKLSPGPSKEQITEAEDGVSELESQLNLIQNKCRYSRYEMQTTKTRLEAAQRNLAKLRSDAAQIQRFDAQEAVVAQLDAALAELVIGIENSTLTAPFDGKIAERQVDEGAIVTPHAPILKIVEDRKLEAWIGLPSAVATGLKKGQPHVVFVGKRSYPAKIGAILPELDPSTRTRTVMLELDDSAATSLVPGELARMEVIDEVPASGYWLPTEALSRGSRGLWSAMAVEDDGCGKETIVRREVEVLHTNGEQVLVRGALRRGDRIVTGGTHRIVPGQKVEAVDAA
ncbi:MAG: efflux RND transporter periplasmic adaptor subunit [Pirellulales bacterium]|nr:efflux RND transporter periplasmic adaptor subunit [Pirellulales bacterium]